MPIGAQISTSGGLSTAVERARAIGAECMQVHLCAPQQWREPRHADDQIASFRAQVAEAGIGPNFAHAIYLINLASPDPALRERSTGAFRACLSWAARSGLAGVVVHIGSSKGQPVDEGERSIVAALRSLLAENPAPRILLENSAGAGNTVGARFSQIGGLIAALDRDPRLGVCLDTAHAFASGYDLRDGLATDAMLDEIDRTIGLDRIAIVHANDSRAGLGSARDRHQNIGRGELGEATFERLLHHPALANLPWVLEVPGLEGKGPDQENIALLRQLAGRS